ncbi:MAG: leucine-rich repeat domain-containing protein [Treponema sp.]|nr:leucine-rich repeat domain-containing protein [Treponema sp.]
MEEERKAAAAKAEASFDYFAAMQPPNPDSDFTYELDSTGKGVTIRSYVGTSDFVTIPTKIEGLPVTGCYSRGVGFFTEVQAARIRGLALSPLILENNVNRLFGRTWPNLRILIYSALREKIVLSPRNYPELKHIVMLDSVTKSGHFGGLPNLESVTFSNSITEIGGDAGDLMDCKKLKKVTLPRSLRVIRSERIIGNPLRINGAFEGCVSLESIDFPDSLTTIENEAFRGCTSLKSVALPANLTQLGVAFQYYIGGSEDQTKEAGDVFSGCRSLETVTFNGRLTEIPGGTFSGCTSLKSVTIPANIKRLRGAFEYSSIIEITFNGNLEDGLHQTVTYSGTTKDPLHPPLTRVVIGKGVTRLNSSFYLPPMSLEEQAKLREVGIRSSHGEDYPPIIFEYQ